MSGHDGVVRLVYKLFGDLVDGTYLGIDTTHAHMNMPATFMWAVGLDARPVRVTFVAPMGSNWTAGTQLYPTGDPLTFTAPNLQYFMDSPTELARLVSSTFSVRGGAGPPADFRVLVHADATQADVDRLATLVRRVVQEQAAVFGEFPRYEPGSYAFLLDYMPWASDDGMEHRNSTFITTGGAGERPGISLKTEQGRIDTLDAISHEFFHNWNVERIRPAGIEPFDFTGANITCCLWMAEGFTEYYGELLLVRAGFSDRAPVGVVNEIVTGSGRQVRSAVQMSEWAPFSDAATSVDPTDASRSFISYYSYGSAIALALDLSLRELSGGAQSLDDYMRLLWVTYGKPDGPAPGLVAKPYSLKDLRDRLADLTGKRRFADEFFDHYVEGRDVPDFARLLAQAGYVVRPRNPRQGWLGNVSVQESGGVLLVGMSGSRPETIMPVPFGTPAYEAGLDEGDAITSIDGQPATRTGWNAIRQRRPGDIIKLGLRRRDGSTSTVAITLEADPGLEVVPVEQTGGARTSAHRAFRESWLGSKVR